MAISENEFKKERLILKKVNKLLNDTIDSLGVKVSQDELNLVEFKKVMWEDANTFDEGEIGQVKLATSDEENKLLQKKNYYKRLMQIKDNPYFASIVFKDEDGDIYNIYISLTYLKDNMANNILYDWRSPICSLFYDYETGPCMYLAPGGEIHGELKRKRQYKIENAKLLSVFDNSLNIDDEVLQEVLATDSSEKMKNVVNTIQTEQNKVIRNLEDNNLIVQGIAGSGKTTVALHRIAFLLYRLKNIGSQNILIFSPNNIFTEYISDVLPSLGENNTMQTTFADYMATFLNEYKDVESFTDFVSRYYSYKEDFPKFVEYKQSDKIIDDLDAFIDNYIDNCVFLGDFKVDEHVVYKDDINKMLHEKYAKLPLMERVDEIAEATCSNAYKGNLKKIKTFHKKLMDNSNFNKKYKDILIDFFESEFCRIKVPSNIIKKSLNKDIINYEDALLMTYLKGALEGFMYEAGIRQVVIDEAQDYNRLQYIIINQIFRRADFTILGDVNQNINPYYHYTSLNDLIDLFRGSTKYLELSKTYRSSPEIIDYTNKILNLRHVNAIRRDNHKPVIIRKGVNDLKSSIIKDIKYLKGQYRSCAIITKDNREAEKIYDLIKNEIDISLVDANSKSFIKELVIIPAYVSKGLEFDSVIIYNDRDNSYKKNERNLLYVACTRCQHELIIYN